MRDHGGRSLGALGALVVFAASLIAVPGSPATAVSVPGAPVIALALAGPPTGVVTLRWRPNNGGLSNITYAFSRSLDGGTTWSTPVSIPGSALAAVSTTVPGLACPNTAPGSKGCRYRVYAKNFSVLSAPSAAVALWVAPSAPAHIGVPFISAAIDSVTFSWPDPTTTGGLPLEYDVFQSMDGAAAQLALTTTGLVKVAILPCTGSVTCTYTVRARNTQGQSAFSSPLIVKPAPSVVTDLLVRNIGTNYGNAVSTVQASWNAPEQGLPAVSYETEQCTIAAGKTTGCESTSNAWKPGPPIAVPTSGSATLTRSCPLGVATCFVRVRGVNARGGSGAWHALSLEPWAPYDVRITRKNFARSLTVTFRGPAESGAGPTASKHYAVFFCAVSCNDASSWRDSGLHPVYPPKGSGPFTAGTIRCGTGRSLATKCRVRMQFIDGTGAASTLSATALG